MMTKLEMIFDEIYDTDAECFENQVPDTFDRCFRNTDDISFDDVKNVEEAWLFHDSVGQCLAVVD
jgi:hypothetical protein